MRIAAMLSLGIDRPRIGGRSGNSKRHLTPNPKKSILHIDMIKVRASPAVVSGMFRRSMYPSSLHQLPNQVAGTRTRNGSFTLWFLTLTQIGFYLRLFRRPK
jgi:hypothetical protein